MVSFFICIYPSVRGRRHADPFLEYPAKISGVIQTDRGGDAGLISSLYATLSGSACEPTLLEYSLDGYKLALAAEKSRASGGTLVNLEEL